MPAARAVGSTAAVTGVPSRGAAPLTGVTESQSPPDSEVADIVKRVGPASLGA
jgi:hypothetical protein